MELTEKFFKEKGFKQSAFWAERSKAPHLMFATDKGVARVMPSLIDGRKWVLEVRSRVCCRETYDHINTTEELNESFVFCKMDKI